MPTTATVVIKSNGSPPTTGNAPVAIELQQHQATPHPALQQRQLLRDPTLPPATDFLLEGARSAFSALAQRASHPFMVTLEPKSRNGVGITVQNSHLPPPLPEGFSGFEVPSFSHPKTASFILRPATHPGAGPSMEFDLGAFLVSRGHGIEDVEPNWYGIHRSASFERIMKWFEDWLR